MCVCVCRGAFPLYLSLFVSNRSSAEDFFFLRQSVSYTFFIVVAVCARVMNRRMTTSFLMHIRLCLRCRTHTQRDDEECNKFKYRVRKTSTDFLFCFSVCWRGGFSVRWWRWPIKKTFCVCAVCLVCHNNNNNSLSSFLLARSHRRFFFWFSFHFRLLPLSFFSAPLLQKKQLGAIQRLHSDRAQFLLPLLFFQRKKRFGFTNEWKKREIKNEKAIFVQKEGNNWRRPSSS